MDVTLFHRQDNAPRNEMCDVASVAVRTIAGASNAGYIGVVNGKHTASDAAAQAHTTPESIDSVLLGWGIEIAPCGPLRTANELR
jgi:hypothetical protein